MKAVRWTRLALTLSMTLAGTHAALAQATGTSTEFLADNRVTFRLYAPEATDVRLSGNWPDGAKVAMTKDDKGIWSATVGPLKSELWTYRFVVNGVPTVDPQNGNVTRDGVRTENILLVPGPESALYG